MRTEIRFSTSQLITPPRQETIEPTQEYRELTIARHFLEFGQRYKEPMDDELIKDIIGKMEFRD